MSLFVKKKNNFHKPWSKISWPLTMTGEARWNDLLWLQGKMEMLIRDTHSILTTLLRIKHILITKVFMKVKRKTSGLRNHTQTLHCSSFWSVSFSKEAGTLQSCPLVLHQLNMLTLNSSHSHERGNGTEVSHFHSGCCLWEWLSSHCMTLLTWGHLPESSELPTKANYTLFQRQYLKCAGSRGRLL